MVNNSPFGLVLVSDAKHVFEEVISGCVERFAPCLRWRIRQFKSNKPVVSSMIAKSSGLKDNAK